MLKELYATRQKEKEQENKLQLEINIFKEQLQEGKKEKLEIIRTEEINEPNNNSDLENYSEASETYTELLENIAQVEQNEESKNDRIELNAIIDEKPSTSGTKDTQLEQKSYINYENNYKKTYRNDRELRYMSRPRFSTTGSHDGA